MSNTVVGLQTQQEQPASWGWVVGRGGSLKRSWKVSDASQIGGLISYIIGTGGGYQVTPQADGAVWLVEANYETDSSGNTGPTSSVPTTPLSEIWERDIKPSEKDLLEANVAIVNNLGNTDKKLIKQGLDEHIVPDEIAFTSSDALTLYTLMYNGVKTWMVYQPVIRRTRMTANNYTVPESDTNVGKILTKAQMTSLEGAPPVILFDLPASGTSYRTTSTNAADINLTLAYLKMPARVTQQGDGKWQILQEWDYGAWPSALFTAAS